MDHVDPGALAAHLARMPGPRWRPDDAANIATTLDYLRGALTDAGWEVREQPVVDVLAGTGVNLLGRRHGTGSRELVAVIAHHDTVAASPGADDNGSGLAAIVEIARALGRGPIECDIELALVDFEERTTSGSASFAGSRAYVASLSPDVHLRGAFVFDLIGFTDRTPGSQRFPEAILGVAPGIASALAARDGRGDTIVAIADATARGGPLLDAVLQASREVPGAPVVPLAVPPALAIGDFLRSDHTSFWEAGLPALFLTDTGNFRSPHYHRPSDTAETLDPEFWAAVVDLSIAAIQRVVRGP